MTANAHNIAALADRLTTLAEAYKEDKSAVLEDAKKADIDAAALTRLASWQRKDAVQRAEQEAIDHQYRFLAGEIDDPAIIPAEGQLAEAARYYRDGLKVRQVAEVMKISVGRAHKLKTLAAMFTDVHQPVNVNTVNKVEMTADDIGQYSGETAELPREMVADDLGDPLLITNPFRARVKAIASAVETQQRAEMGAEPRHTGEPPQDDYDPGPIPDGLRRVPA